MERSRIITISLVFFSSTTVFLSLGLIDASPIQFFVLIGLVTCVHLIATLCARFPRIAPIAPLFSFFILLSFLLVTNSQGDLTQAIPSPASLLNVFQDSQSGVKLMRDGTIPFSPDREIFLVAIILTWVIAEIGETLAQRLHTCTPTLLWYLIVNALIFAQNDSISVWITTGLICGASFLFLWSFEKGHEEIHSHVIEIDNVSSTSNYLHYATTFVAILAISMLISAPVATLPSLAPDDLLKFLKNENTKTELSPLVSMTQQLKNEKTQVMFTANSNEVQYFRVAVLDDFNGQSWNLLSEIKEDPETPPQGVATRPLNGKIQLASLSPKFLPTVYSTQEISAKEVEFLKGSVILSKDQSVKNYSFEAIGTPTELTPEQIDRSSEDTPSSTDVSTLLPKDFDKDIINKAREIASGKSSIYEQVISLRDFFLDGSFTYDLNVDYSSDENSIKSFLEQRRGFCEQFATTYAALARSVGIPARVIVGFTPGQPDANGTFVVTNKQAHSWVEVYLSNFGWLQIDPTPPGPLPGQSQTGLGAQVSTTTTTTTTVPTTASVPGSITTTTKAQIQDQENSDSQSSALIAATVFVLLVGGSGAFLFATRKQRKLNKNDGAYIVATFKEIGERVLDFEPQPDLTIDELSKKVPKENVKIHEFLDLLEIASYAPNGTEKINEVKQAALKARNEKVLSNK